MPRFASVFLAALPFCLAFFLATCNSTAAGQVAPVKPDTGMVALGRSQFSASCSFCHGANAAGGAEGPNLMRSSVVRHDHDGDVIGKVIREGRPNTGMPPIPLSEQQIAGVVAFLHAQLATSDRTSAGRPKQDYSLKRLLTGNAEAGKTFFNGAGGCSHCHSPRGDLAGIATKYAPVDLQARFLYPAGAPETATVKLASGETVSGELLHLDSFYVAIRDSDDWYHSWSRRNVAVEVRNPLAPHIDLLPKYTDADVHNLFAYLETLK